jgi:hypothetical protein
MLKKIQKLEHLERALTKMEEKIRRIECSSLKISQLIHAIKTYILSMPEYSMRYNWLSQDKLGKMNRYIRKIINSKMNGRALPK